MTNNICCPTNHNILYGVVVHTTTDGRSDPCTVSCNVDKGISSGNDTGKGLFVGTQCIWFVTSGSEDYQRFADDLHMCLLSIQTW